MNHICNCTPYYLRNVNDVEICRFGFPKPVIREIFAQDDRVFLRRNARSTLINAYNPHLLSVWRASMDIQLCYNTQVDVYMSKYSI